MTSYSSIVVVDVDGGTSSAIRATPSNNSAPAWSPGGSAIAFTMQDHVGNSRLAVMNPDGSDVRILGSTEWNDMGFAWLP